MEKEECRLPLYKYFGGHGQEVMSSMKKTYKDPKKAKQVFYATANKRKQNPEGKK